ncbi:MAG: hypothetical protein V7K97_24450 [Nostoc sp.]|uniref:hypothetical protein n=1 Tax=Nostoc sp. TaxID=1180 RepID=UPI002FF99141
MPALLTKHSTGREAIACRLDISRKEKDPTSIPLPVGVSLSSDLGREALKPPNASREGGKGG